MPPIAVDQARAGMVLASEVVDRRGRLLVPAGVELTDRHLAALRMWGVASVDIEGDEPADDSEPVLDEAALERAREATEELFGNCDREHPFVGALFDLSRRRLAVEIARGEGR